MTDRTKLTLKGAIATTRGWVDEKTGELLVSIRGLPNAVEWEKNIHLKAKAEEPQVEEPVKTEEPKVEEPKVETVEAPKKTSKKSRNKKTSEAK